MFRIKICGITNVSDALVAAKAGADAIGLNFYKNSPRFVSVETAAKIAEAAWLEFYTESVAVFVNESPETVASILDLYGVFLAQLHGDESAEYLRELKRLLPAESSGLIRVLPLGIDGVAAIERDLAACRSTVATIDAVLVDAQSANHYGGTGATVNWQELADHRRWLGNTPLILAGGLTPDNVAEAIRIVRPHGVDVASGVESSPGKKDLAKVRDFVAAARDAFAQLK